MSWSRWTARALATGVAVALAVAIALPLPAGAASSGSPAAQPVGTGAAPPAVMTGAGAVPTSVRPNLAGRATGGGIGALADANVGRHACSTNSLGGRFYESSCTGNGGLPEYWCADFARWVWGMSGVDDTGWLTAAAGSFYTYGERFHTLSSVPAVGDAAVFNYYGGGDAEHVAIVTAVRSDGAIETVSGDWGGDNGSEARFASTSAVVRNIPAYAGVLGSVPHPMGMTLSGFVAPVGGRVTPVMASAVLASGRSLASGARLVTLNGQYRLEMRPSGNLIETGGGRTIWTTGTAGHRGATAALATDGDLTVVSSTGTTLWSSHSAGGAGAYHLALSDEGRLSIWGRNGAVWARQGHAYRIDRGNRLDAGQELVSANGLFVVAMQRDGNFVEYTGGRALWWTGSAAHDARAVMQSDGNLVVYGSDGHALWSSGTAGAGGSIHALVRDSGAFEVRRGSGRVLWSDGV